MNQIGWKFPSALVLTALIAVGLASSGYFIGRGIEKFRTSDRAVTVKGFSEREVKSDLGELYIIVKNVGNDLVELQKKNEQDKKIVIEFLKQHGIQDANISIISADVFDRLAREYQEQGKSSDFRYISTTELKVTTSSTDVIEAIMTKASELVNKQVNASLRPRYYFTKFAELRNEMIAESTTRAREAALQFAKDSGSKVGSIRNATQGLFTITSAYNESYDEGSSFLKKIRVVSTVVFNLLD